jgi:phosphomannomutase
MNINPLIFRAYDVRGVYGRDLTDELAEKIGSASVVFLGKKIAFGRDSRLSSPALGDAFIKGATEAGTDVIDIGLVPRGMLMFWCWKKALPGAYITASHSPKEWNGVQFMYRNGQGFSEEGNMKIRDAVLEGRLKKSKNPGSVGKIDIKEEYMKSLMEKIPKPSKKLKVLLDCGNGTAGIVAQEAFSRAGIEADVLFREPDGNFPNRESDITEDTLKKAASMAKNYDVVFAYDGDSDRLALIDSRGRLAEAEDVACLILSELMKKEKGPVVANVECSSVIDKMAARHKRGVERVRVGNTFMVQAMHDTGACFGVEKARHFVIPSIFPFDDAIAVSLFAAYAISKMGRPLSAFLDGMPKFEKSRTNIECPDDKKFGVIERVRETLSKEYGRINTMDGIRLDLDGGWVLVRASNTSPLIRVTVEAESRREHERMRDVFSGLVRREINKYKDVV